MTRIRSLALVAVLAFVVPTASHAVIPDAVPNLPFLEAQTTTGSLVVSDLAAVAPTPKTVDGSIADWTGSSTMLGGTSILSHGELVFQNYLNSGWGADDGFDAQRLDQLAPLTDAEPRLYRVDALRQAAGAQFGAARPVGASMNYGDVKLDDTARIQANIEEARVAADADNLYVLVRTLRMDEPVKTAVLVLVDTASGGSYALPANAGGLTTSAEWAFVVSGNQVLNVLFQGAPTGSSSSVVAAYDASTTINATEIAISRALLGSSNVRVGVAAGIRDGAGFAHVATGDAKSDLVSVAFRNEPARIWMDQAQALALRDGVIDQWLANVDMAALGAGATQTFQQRAGYYEAIYIDDTSIANFESISNAYYQGAFQHYGLYLPANYRPGRVYPATVWCHYRGGHAHDAAAWEPGIAREFGDEIGAIVVMPSARGESSWYTGRGMVDFLDMWDDTMARFKVDPDRVYLGGHSMGGWASYLLGLLMPDRWAASNPEDGLLVPGLWAGAGDPSGPQNGADIKAEFLLNILDNARNLPYAILHGTEDELVPITSAYGAASEFHKRGYRYRLYDFHAYEHYSAPIWDDWREVVAYMTTFKRDPAPARVSYNTWPALEHAVSTISMPAGKDLALRFNGAYWVSGMQTRTAGIDPTNIGKFDATTYGRGVGTYLALPEAGGCNQIEPCTMLGQRWLPTGATSASNRFTATLSNLSTATLDLAKMGLGTSSPITASVTTDGAGDLVLTGTWHGAPSVSGATASLSANGLTLHFAGAGMYAITIG